MGVEKYPEYKTSDLNIAFRTAANAGRPDDLIFMRMHIADPELNINARGGDSGMNALDRACQKGKLDAVKLLLAYGADDTTAEASALKATANKETILRLLRVHRLAKQAYQQAIKFFSQKPTESSDQEFDKLGPEITAVLQEELNKVAKAFAERVRKIPANVPDEKVEAHNAAALQFQDYCKYLLLIRANLLVTHKRNFKYEYAGAVSSFVFCSLLESGFNLDRFDVFSPQGNGSMLVINRAPGSNPRDPKTWGPDAYVVERFGKRYPASAKPIDSLLPALSHPLCRIEMASSRLPNLRDLHVPERIELAQKTQGEIFQEMTSMLRNLFGKEAVLGSSAASGEEKKADFKGPP